MFGKFAVSIALLNACVEAREWRDAVRSLSKQKAMTAGFDGDKSGLVTQQAAYCMGTFEDEGESYLVGLISAEGWEGDAIVGWGSKLCADSDVIEQYDISISTADDPTKLPLSEISCDYLISGDEINLRPDPSKKQIFDEDGNPIELEDFSKLDQAKSNAVKVNFNGKAQKQSKFIDVDTEIMKVIADYE